MHTNDFLQSASDHLGHRRGKSLIDASREFAQEDRVLSWYYLITTIVMMVTSICVAAVAPSWPIRLVFAIFSSFTIVRMFILYHDYQHGSILRDSSVARVIFYVYSMLVMAPPRVWRQTHNYHHAHNAKLLGSHVGSYAMVTPAMYADMGPIARAFYRLIRHPFTILFAYFTIFMYGMCISPLLRSGRKNWDSALALIINFTLTWFLISSFGFLTFFFVFWFPFALAMAIGGYLFYAQHNFPEIYVQRREEWEYTRAAIDSSSYMKMGPIMRWVCGNIGYHHVHHLNARIPFYRLPEAMAAIPELHNPHTTSWGLRDVMACFRLKLWDPSLNQMVGYKSADSEIS